MKLTFPLTCLLLACSGGDGKTAPDPSPHKAVKQAAVHHGQCADRPQGPMLLSGTLKANGALSVHLKAEDDPPKALHILVEGKCVAMPVTAHTSTTLSGQLTTKGAISVFAGGPNHLNFGGPGPGVVEPKLSAPRCVFDGVISPAKDGLKWSACGAEEDCQNGRCVCPNTCQEEDRQCGFDPCGNDCGQCPGEWPCSPDGRCRDDQ